MSEIIDEQVIDERGSTEIEDKRVARDRLVWDNFKQTIFPSEAEKAWRHYKTGGLLPTFEKGATKEDGRRLDVFDPEYPPCPAFTKIDKSIPFDLDPITGNPKGNIKRCGFEIPENYKGKGAMYYAQAHMMEEHWLEWKEVYSRRKGQKNPHGESLPSEDARDEAPPMDSTFEWPKWKTKGSASQADKSDGEIKRDEAQLTYKKSMRGKNLAKSNKDKKGSEVDGSTGDIR